MIKDVSFLTQNLIAHRGLHNNTIPENSLASFEEAIKHGYIIELDLRILKDGNVVVFHDDFLERMTGVKKKLSDCTYPEIKNLKLLNSSSTIPLFEDALKFIKGKVPIVIELKSDRFSNELEEKTIKLLKSYNGKFAIKSFNPYSIYYIRKKYPEIIIGQLSSNFKNSDLKPITKLLLKHMMFNFITKPDFLSLDIHSLPNKKAKNFRKKRNYSWLDHKK